MVDLVDLQRDLPVALLIVTLVQVDLHLVHVKAHLVQVVIHAEVHQVVVHHVVLVEVHEALEIAEAVHVVVALE